MSNILLDFRKFLTVLVVLAVGGMFVMGLSHAFSPKVDPGPARFDTSSPAATKRSIDLVADQLGGKVIRMDQYFQLLTRYFASPKNPDKSMNLDKFINGKTAEEVETFALIVMASGFR